MMNIYPIKALSDNYIWVIEKGKEAVVVDPGEAEGVLDLLEQNQLSLEAILLTHDHHDHTDGVNAIIEKFPDTPVYGPVETKALADHVVQEGDAFELLGHDFQVFKTAGHSSEHISFITEDTLFCGDALFSAGCGRVFTGDYQAQYEALQKFKKLADRVEVFCGHEYTQKNLRFACSIEPSNKVLSDALNQVNKLREEDRPTLPTTIGKEKAINLFLQAETLEAFTELRKARDAF